MREPRGSRGRWRSALGWGWILGWGWLLWSVTRPWDALGGLVDERLRWSERAALCAGAIVGHTLGELARPGAVSGRAKARRARWLLYPVALATAAVMVWLRLTGRDDPIGVASSGWLAYTAGATSGLLGCGRSRPEGTQPVEEPGLPSARGSG